MFGPVLIYALVVGALAWAEYKGARSAQVWFKTLAALGFCVLAILSGALYSGYGQIILMGLWACALGDLLLLPRDKPLFFKLGMLAFALGHVFYAYGFFTQGGNVIAMAVAALIMSVVSAGFYRYVGPHLPRDMKVPVMVYTVIITFMVVFAVATKDLLLILPALMFAVSDMFVARDRFVVTEPRNALAITPLYFGAQALFALNVFG